MPTYRSKLYKVIQAAAEKSAPSIKSAFTKEVSLFKDELSVKALQDSIGAGSSSGATNTVRWKSFEKSLQSTYEKSLTKAMANGAEGFQELYPQFGWDPSDPAVKREIVKRSKLLARQLTQKTKEGFRKAASNVIKQDIGPSQGAQLLKESFGLTKIEAQAAFNQRAGLIVDGKTATVANKRAMRSFARFRGKRATRIAVSTSKNMASAGQHSVLKKAITDGLMKKSNVQREWVVGADPCEIVCTPMDGQLVGMEQLFETGLGDMIDLPPAHQNCKCIVAIVFKQEPKRRGRRKKAADFTSGVKNLIAADFMRSLLRHVKHEGIV